MVDDYAPFEPVAKCEPYFTDEDVAKHRPGVAAFRDLVLGAFGGSSLGVGRDCGIGSASKHHESRAWDWAQPSNEAADQLGEQLTSADAEGNADALARRFGLRTIIWNRRIWTARTKEWRPYSGADPHTSHVHFGFSWAGALGQTSGYQGGAASRLLPFCPGGSGDSGGDLAGTEGAEVSFFQWRTEGDGRVFVDQGDGFAPISLAGGPIGLVADRVLDQWGSLAAQKARKYDVPVQWVLGFILQESAGDPSAVSPAGAVGLMQIVPKWHPSVSRAELFDPEANVDYGTSLLRDSRALGYDLPEAASRYNAGATATGDPHPSTTSPWGMREQPGYISGVVRGANHYHGKATPTGPGWLGRVGPLSVFLLAGVAWYAASSR